MEDIRKVYKVRAWLGEACIRCIDEDVEDGILQNIEDCMHFAKGYCTTSGCIPNEIIEHIFELKAKGAIR